MLSSTIARAKLLKHASPVVSAVRSKAAYEGDGKTTVRVINQEEDAGLMIDTYATYGFKLNNGLTVLGPMAIFPRTVMSWQVTEAAEVTQQSLMLFKLLVPKIDLLVIGLEAKHRERADRVRRAAAAAGLNVEVLPTEHACSTFNFLNSEGRSVAGALIPPLFISNMSPDDMLHTKLHYQDVFNKPIW
ncbi:hypothetical protein HW555_012395 [Spodoptera exigua]|uniref:NADH dehydrogenase [ubiquinone] 1 alpha subcomplex assembly factor 3 n=1 Tax=Spodoptera exigua TaxID=7107 RepID=A0A835G3J9_SPOEX|nr:hypothetical protein HW555_012395 [Spodoptera exigua]